MPAKIKKFDGTNLPLLRQDIAAALKAAKEKLTPEELELLGIK